MRTAYCPESHVELAAVRLGDDHFPGQHYHDVDVVVSCRSHRYRVHVVESWGSDQGYNEERGRYEVIGRGDSVDAAIRNARERATRANITQRYLEQALSKAEDEAIEAEAFGEE